MTTKEFVIEYDKLIENKVSKEDLESFINKNIKIKYVPVGTKLSDCTRVINATSYLDNELTNKKEFKVSSTSTYILFLLQIIDRYTTIDINFNEVTGQYDSLKSRGLIDIINLHIPKTEIDEYNLFMEMKKADLIQNEYEIGAFISKKVDAITGSMDIAFNPMIAQVGEFFKQLDEEKVSRMIDKITNNKMIQKLMK